MVRRVAAVVFALAFQATLVPVANAQSVALTIDVSSADVYAGPSNIYPVVGHASRGTAVPVTKNLGSWVKVAWPSAPEGVGYIHVTMGRLGPPKAAIAAAKTPAPAAQGPKPAAQPAPRPATQAPRTAAAAPAPRPAPVAAPVAPRAPAQGGTTNATTSTRVAPPSHIFGAGGSIGSMSSYGASARIWQPGQRRSQLGLQLAFTRDSQTSAVDGSRVTATQFEPAVIFAPIDRVSDYIWFRPYVGSGVSFRSQTLEATAVSENGVG